MEYHYVTFDGGSGVGKGAIIEWCAQYLRSHGKSVAVLCENRIDPLRDYGAMMVDWCEKNGVEKERFFLSLIAAGQKIAEKTLEEALLRHDVVLRDRSLFSSLAYRAASGVFTTEELWDLHVQHMGLTVPDLTVIVDADIDIALSRIASRDQKDIGLGGKMSGGREQRVSIRKCFLSLQDTFKGRAHIVVVTNNGLHTTDTKILNERLAVVCEPILVAMRADGVELDVPSTTFNRFAEVFRENISARSRTAKGVSDISSSSEKRPLLKDGEALQRHMKENVEKLIRAVWVNDRGARDPDRIRKLFEEWYDTIHVGLQDLNAYKHVREILEKKAKKLASKSGKPYRVNHRYRTWSLTYTERGYDPVELEIVMDGFYKRLSRGIEDMCSGKITEEHLLAWTDWMMDQVIHPWSDGCGRLATAAVMWLSLLSPKGRAPRFQDRSKHYHSIKNLEKHTAYYKQCLT